MIAAPLLTIIADVLGIMGGLIIGVVQGGISFHLYMSYTLTYVELTDVIPGLLKTIFFGMLVGTVASYYGFTTTGGTEGVGNSTKACVVTSSLLIVVSDVILTRILLWIFGG
jgi:phospholipid/cholesterol/gamma-HCH transport system permease protein